MKWIRRKNFSVTDDDVLIIEKLATIRGIENLDEWLNPSSSNVHSPYLLKNIDEAVQMIIKAIHKSMNITIVADIDTDGVCSTGIMYNYLLQLSPNVRYIHAQRSKGHGVETVLDQIVDEDELIIIVDSSSNSVEGCKVLQEKGKDVIIIDHHLINTENPHAVIVNCQMGTYPNKDLSGSAMCYKVCQVLDDYLDIELADEYLDLTAIGLVADMMNVKSMENRYLIHKGMYQIKNYGIQEILKQSNIDYSEGINTTNISFKIAPIIGACSRFDKIEMALEIVTSDDFEQIHELTQAMIHMNEKRKSEQKETVEAVIENLDTENNVIVVIDNEISSGFRGLIATEIVERFSKPVFVLAEHTVDGEVISYRGSGRSVGLLKLKSFCEESGLVEMAQGHEMAFGVEIAKDNLNDLIVHFNRSLDEEDLQKVVKYDLELDINDVDDIDIKQIEKFSRITGQGFPEPKFLITGIVAEEGNTKKLGNHVRAVMGKNNDTVKVNCEDGVALMKFRTQDSYMKDVEEYFYSPENFCTELEVVGSLNLNKFYNFGVRKWVVTRQVFVEDYKIID